MTDTRTDVRALRALAHPLRLRLLDLLRFDGPSTATLLAARVGESTGSTSYHLRLLGKYGYVEDVKGDNTGRERWWRYRERRVTLPHGQPDAGRELLGELLSREAHALDAYLAGRRDDEWDDAAFFHSQAFRLTPGELDQLRRSIEALLKPLRRADAEEMPDGALPVRVLAFGFSSVADVA